MLDLKNQKTIYTIIGITIGLLIVGYSIIWGGTIKKEVENESLIVGATNGINVDYLTSREDGRKVVFERYRLVDQEKVRTDFGPEGTINISEDNARVFLTHPDGTKEEITSELWYIPLRIIPPIPEGAYKMIFRFKSNETVERTVQLPSPKETQLVKTGLTRTEESLNLTAFGLEGVDLGEASLLYYIDPQTVPHGGSTPILGWSDYFWINMGEKLNGSQEGEHIFMAKVNDVWYYAIVNYPEDFE